MLPNRHGLADPGCVERFGSKVQLVDDLSGAEHDNAIGNRDQFVKIGRDDNNRGAACRRIDQRIADRCGRREVEPLGWTVSDDDGENTFELAADHQFLLVAAGQVMARRPGADGRTEKRRQTSVP